MGEGLQVIDTHFHMWDPQIQRLDWLKEMGPLIRRWTVDDLAAEYEALGVDFLGGVYVEVDSADPGQEARLLSENKDPRILARMLRSRVSPYMPVPINATGIREPLHTADQPRGRCLQRSFIEGLEAMADRGIPFELCNRGGELADMARAFGQVPQERVIIDHLGNMPDLSPESRKAMEALAGLPECYVKVSGDDPVDAGIVRFVRDAFPPDRILYASNWPVVNRRSSLAAHFRRVFDIFGPDEGFFRDNAQRAYGIQ